MMPMYRTLRRMAEKAIYTATIASMVFGSLGLAGLPTPASAGITILVNTSSVATPQTIGPSSAPTAVQNINIVSNAADTLDVVRVAVSPSAGFVMSDLAPLGTGASSGIALYRDDGATQGSFDNTDSNVALGNISLTDGSTRISKLMPSSSMLPDSLSVIDVGDLLYTDVSANGAPTTGFGWHVITAGSATVLGGPDLRLDGAAAAPTYRNGNATRTSHFDVDKTGLFVVNGADAIVPTNVAAPRTYAAPAVGDIVYYQTGASAGTWGLVTASALTSGTFAINGTALANGTYRISKIVGQTGSFVLPGEGAIPAPGAGYTAPALGDIVLYRPAGSPVSYWGIVTNATLTAGTFAVDNMALSPGGTYQLSKVTAYNPSTALTGAIPTGEQAVNTGDLVFGLPTRSPVTVAYNWHIATGDTTASGANLRLDGAASAPVFGFSVLFDPIAEAVPANDAGANEGADYYITFRTSAGAVNGHAFTAGVAPGTFESGGTPIAGLPTETLSATYTIATSAQQQQSAGANTTVIDLTNGFLKLKQGSNFKPVARVQFGSNENTKTLTSITTSFTAVDGTPTWPASGATSSELLDLATSGGGVSLWKDGGSPGFGLNGAGDTQITLAASPVYGASNAFTITPETAPTLASDDVYFIVLKSDTSGVTNNNSFRMSMAANAIVTSGTSPAIPVFQTPAIRMDTSAPTISSVAPVNLATPNQLRVQFSEPVQKISSGGAITFASATDPFTFTDGGGTAQTITAISHSAFNAEATLTMSATLDVEDFDGTPATLAAVANKIEDGAGNVMGTVATNLGSPLTLTTPTIPGTYVGAVYTADVPLVTFAAAGGTAPYTFTGNTQADTDALVALFGAAPLAGATGKLTGTVQANTAGTRNVTIKVTDNVAATAVKQFTINVAATQGGGVPGLTNITPPSGSQGATDLSLTITGTNTNFTGASTVAFAFPPGDAGTNGITVGTVVANSATSITVPITIAAGATLGARDVVVTSGNQVANMPRGFSVTGVVAAGLNLVFPTDAATGVTLPQPGFNFNPSTNATFTNYRVTVSTAQDFSTTVWDYAFPKPADAQNTNGSHCTSTACNARYGEGKFYVITQPTPLAPNTTYYWRVQTYQGALTSAVLSNVLNKIEDTPVRSFTTVTSVTDTRPPQIEHRPIYEARANAALTVYARVIDDIARTSTSPALSATLFACQGAACVLPATSVLPGASATDGVVAGDGTVGSNYFSFAIPSEIIGAAAGTTIRYYLSATDGTNTNNFYQPGGSTPFSFTTTAPAAATITGTVKDSSDTCSASVRQAVVFAEGTGFSATSTNDENCTFSLGGLTVGAPYDLIAVKDGFSDRRRDGVPAGSTSIGFQLGQGVAGGFGGDTTRPRVMRTMPGDKMQNLPGGDSNMKIFVVFDKPMSQTSVTTNGNMSVNDVNVQTGELTNITTTKGAWAYNATYVMPFGGTESNVAVWSLSAGQTLGDNKTISVKATPSVTDTNGNAIQGNLSDGSFAFTFTTGSTASFNDFNANTNTFSGGGTFGEGNFVPPHVVSTTPPMGAQSVPRNTKTMINFDRAMADDGGGYTLLSALKLFEVTALGVATEVSSAALDTATLTSDKMGAQITLKATYPSGCVGAACAAFKASTRYRLQVIGSAKAANGMTMRAPNQAAEVAYTSEFNTSATTDDVAPTITGSIPDTGATNVPSLLGAVSVSFSKDMDSSTITSSTMTLTAGSTTVSGSVEYRPMERTAYFLPSRVLTPTTQYTLTLTTGIQGVNGVAIAAATRSFTTGAADASAPVIMSMTADDTNIAITFSKPMNSSPATDTSNFTASVLRVANYTVKYGAAGFDAAAGTTLILPATAQITYDAKNNTAIIQGYRPTATTTAQIRGQELYVSLANVKDIGGNAISTANDANTARATVQSSATTQGQLGPMTITDDLMKKVGGFQPDSFSSGTFGFAPQAEVKPFNMMTGTTTIYSVRLPISKQIPNGGTIVLSFPAGFDISGAKQDINSPKRRDINGPGSGTITFKCLTNVTGMSAKSCGGGVANADDTGTAQGGLADDGVVVNNLARTITMYVSGATQAEGHDFLDFDIAGIVNSTIPKDFNTTGYTVDVKTKNATTILESITSLPFFIQSRGTTVYSLTGTITATSNNQAGTISVFLDSPMTGPLETTSADFASGTTATYTFSNLAPGDYFLRTEPYVTIGTVGAGATEYLGKVPPERVVIGGNTTRDFTLTSATAAGTGTAVTVSVDGPASENIDIFANGPSGFRVMQKTLDAIAGAEDFTIRLSDGDWMLGVGPQMPKGQMSGPPPSPSYLPPRPVNLRITGGACVIEGAVTCTKAFTLTSSTKQIRGIVKDLASKVIANAEVFAYSPSGGVGNFAKTDTTGTFTLNVTEGLFNVGAMVQGMPPSKEVPVEVTSHATDYLKIDGVSTAITPATAATTFILKLAKPDYTISGKVTDGTNVINGASVYAYKQGAPGNVSAPTDSSGNYSLFVSAGTWKVGVFLPKYGNLSEQTVTITTANATDINFSPSGTGTFYAVSGTVTVGGVAREGARVRIRNSSYFNETFSATDGTYSFSVPTGNSYIVDGFVLGVGDLAPLAAFNVAADTAGKDLTVATLRTITITFSTSVSRAFVELRSTTGANVRKEIKNSTTGTLSAPDGSYIVNVDLQGAPIPFASIAATDGTTTYASATGVVTVNGDEGLTVTVPTLRTLTITVQDGATPAVALADAWVELMNPTSGEHFGGKTATNGQVVLLAADGSYFISAMKPGYYLSPTSLTVSANAAQTLTLAAASRTISGQVLIGGTGVPNAFVRAAKQGGGFAGTQTDANGQYVLSVSTGIWRVLAVADGYAETELSETVNTTDASASGKNITLATTVAITAPKSQPMTPSTGGTFEDTAGGIRVNVPASALGSSSSAGNMLAKKTTSFIETDTARPVAAIEISVTDANGTPIKTLNESVTIELTYTKAELALIASSSDSSINTKSEVDKMVIGFWDESVQNWTTLSTNVTYYATDGAVVTNPSEDLSNVAAVKLSAQTDHFSLYAPLVSTDPSAPSTPSGLSASAASTTQLNLSWTVVAGATGYDIYRSTSSSGTYSRIGSEPTVSSGSTVTYSDTGLTASTTYYYKITALNNNGESAASSAIAGTTSSASSSSSSGGGGGGGSSYVATTTASTAAKTETKTEATTTAKSVISSIGSGKFEITVPAKSATSATPAKPATPAVPGVTPAKPATPAVPATPAIAAQKLVAGVPAAKVTTMPSFSRYLAQGARDTKTKKDVSALQLILQANGYYKGKISGIFNADTVKAVKKLQEAAKIATAKTVGYGNVGTKTRAFLNSLVKDAKTQVKESPKKAQAQTQTLPEGAKRAASFAELKGLTEKDLWRDPVSKAIYILQAVIDKQAVQTSKTSTLPEGAKRAASLAELKGLTEKDLWRDPVSKAIYILQAVIDKQAVQTSKTSTPPEGAKRAASLAELRGLSEKDLWRDPVSKAIYILKK